ncbi:MAG: hypothetical protein JWQ16_1117 [Novosphingobium sp.]|nr:hypothetical protein [Novosphingobium sp.]
MSEEHRSSPGTGRGTICKMVVGHGRGHLTSSVALRRLCPSTPSCAGGPPPRSRGGSEATRRPGLDPGPLASSTRPKAQPPAVPDQVRDDGHTSSPAGERGDNAKRKKSRTGLWPARSCSNQTSVAGVKSARTAGEAHRTNSPTRPCGAKRRRSGLAPCPSAAGAYPEFRLCIRVVADVSGPLKRRPYAQEPRRAKRLTPPAPAADVGLLIRRWGV